MIDTGYKSEANASLIPYLRDKRIKHIHHLYISHPHRDHYEGVASLWDAEIPIDNIYYNLHPEVIKDCCYNKNHFQAFLNKVEIIGSKLYNVSVGHKLQLPHNSSIEVLHAQKSARLNNEYLDINDMSLIMRRKINGFDVLFTGDLNKKLGTYLARDSRMKADFLKVPHHGAYGIAPNLFFDRVNQDFVMVPGVNFHWCGERGAQARQWTYHNKIPHWVNGLHGNIRVDFSINGNKIFREKSGNYLPEVPQSAFAGDALPNPYLFD